MRIRWTLWHNGLGYSCAPTGAAWTADAVRGMGYVFSLGDAVACVVTRDNRVRGSMSGVSFVVWTVR